MSRWGPTHENKRRSPKILFYNPNINNMHSFGLRQCTIKKMHIFLLKMTINKC